MAYIRARTSSKFGQIRLGTKELAALELLKINVAPFSRFTVVFSQVSVYRIIGPLVAFSVSMCVCVCKPFFVKYFSGTA